MPKGIPKDPSEKRKALHQLKIAKGHLEKVIKMVEEDEYCIDVAHQSLAVQAALKKIDQRILKHHMQHCVADAVRRGKDKEVIDEVMKVMEKM
jgi:CsoR family transcriptional regulator, copper-sensing transcriptional repressor